MRRVKNDTWVTEIGFEIHSYDEAVAQYPTVIFLGAFVHIKFVAYVVLLLLLFSLFVIAGAWYYSEPSHESLSALIASAAVLAIVLTE